MGVYRQRWNYELRPLRRRRLFLTVPDTTPETVSNQSLSLISLLKPWETPIPRKAGNFLSQRDRQHLSWGYFGTLWEAEPIPPEPDYKFVINPMTRKLDRVVNNISVLKADADTTDPTGGGGAATGRLPIVLQDGTTVYIAYY